MFILYLAVVCDGQRFQGLMEREERRWEKNRSRGAMLPLKGEELISTCRGNKMPIPRMRCGH